MRTFATKLRPAKAAAELDDLLPALPDRAFKGELRTTTKARQAEMGRNSIPKLICR